MSKKTEVVMMLLGAVLIFSALLLFASNRYENIRAGRAAEQLLTQVQAVMAERTPSESVSASAAVAGETGQEGELLDSELPVAELDGYGYVGYLSIPDLELELPVMSEWDNERLKIAPCRHFGSSRTDDLVIAAHNYKRHFGLLNQLQVGSMVVFTDMDHLVNTYAVEKIETLKPTEVDAVQNSAYDLVLYTCTKGGQTRIVVFCSRI